MDFETLSTAEVGIENGICVMVDGRANGMRVTTESSAVEFKMALPEMPSTSDDELWSNFTYYLDDPVNGDQFEQVDERWIYGGQASYVWHTELAGLAMSNRIGADLRYDDISEVGLYHTQNRQRLGTDCPDGERRGEGESG